MKKIYTKPSMNLVEFEMNDMICTSVNNVNGGDTNLIYKGGGNGSARSNNRGIWEDE